MPENQTAWNYNNQGVKETFTQKGKEALGGGDDHSKAADNVGEKELADQETKDSKPLPLKSCGVVKATETPSLAGEFLGKRS